MEELRSRAIAAANAIMKTTKKFVFTPKSIMMLPTTKPPESICQTPPKTTACTPSKGGSPKSSASSPPACIESGSAGGASGGGSGRSMKYPYTHTAKFFQMPWKYYINNNWHYKYFFLSVILCLPVFKWIQNGMNSPTNVAKWEALQQKDREEQAQHHH